MRRLQHSRYGYAIRQLINESFQLLARDFTFTCHRTPRSPSHSRTIRRRTHKKYILQFMKCQLMTQKACISTRCKYDWTNSWHRMTQRITHMKATAPLPKILFDLVSNIFQDLRRLVFYSEIQWFCCDLCTRRDVLEVDGSVRMQLLRHQMTLAGKRWQVAT